MDVFLMIRRHKTHIFCDTKESSSVLELKKIIEGILKVSPANQQLFRIDDERDLSKCRLLDDHQLLSDVGLNATVGRAQQPAVLGLCFKKEDGSWEPLEMTSISEPPELPDVMKSAQSDAGHSASSGAQLASQQAAQTAEPGMA